MGWEELAKCVKCGCVWLGEVRGAVDKKIGLVLYQPCRNRGTCACVWVTVMWVLNGLTMFWKGVVVLCLSEL